MTATCIPYTRVPKSSALLIDYLYHFDRLATFFTASPFDIDSYRTTATLLRNWNGNRPALIEILKRQNAAFGASPETFSNIQRLAEPGTFAVVTGQQVGLLSGPAFTLYKALTAVRLAQHLSSEGLLSVPVFWLATEDHDLEEVSRAAALDEDYQLVTLRDAGERPAPRSSVGHVKLSPEINHALATLEAVLPRGEPRERLLTDLRACYQPGVRWSEAFGRLMARLFGRWGVVLLDPLDEAVHRLSAEVYRRSLAHAGDFRQRLRERSAVLVNAGYHAQVHVGDQSTLVFLTASGNRESVTEREGEFHVDGLGTLSLTSLQSHLESRPVDFSPNVLLRPVTQDFLLPTVAYVAGPSELAYLAQAQALYSAFGRPLPVIFLRAGFTLLDGRTGRIVEKYQLGIEDVWDGDEHLGRKIAAAGFAEGWAERFRESERDLSEVLERLRRDVETLDPTLLDSLTHAQEKMQYQMERLKGKISRAALQRSDVLQRHVDFLNRFLFPGRSLQEREISGVYFLGRAGYQLLHRLLDNIQTRSSDHQVISY